MLFVDVNGLKSINDSLGHKVGDQALIHVAKLLVTTIRKTDFVARMHGDEFGILLDDTDEWAALNIATRVFESVAASPLYVDGNSLSLGLAIGVGAIKRGDDSHSVVHRADEQMYRVKTGQEARLPVPVRSFSKPALVC
jgi:diguanylate cyclase (GGDEF)-like protein